ncbi:unnamed protein product [Orchesella dallaii]|uniref:SH3b domain-containing protein n=1 Tax=Orchesella dallaii TaxID=48710 RepID=A0ABP1QWX5_9HEXA
MIKIACFLTALLAVSTSAEYTGPTNQAGLNLIKEFEGFYANFYTDPVGIKTIGYGHACHVWNCAVPLNGKYNVPLTQATAEALLKEDLVAPGRYEQCVANAVTYANLNANQFSALASFTFNLGCGNLQSSTLLSLLNRGDVSGAAEEFAKWVYAGGQILPGLVRRRAAEKELFCSGGTCGTSTTCRGVTNDGINIRSSPSTSASVVGSLASGTAITITDRASGTNVNGNPYWFKISNGYVSAYYVNISSSNGAAWCAKN